MRIEGDPDIVDVVVDVKGMALDVVRRGTDLDAETLEEHYRDVNPFVARGDNAAAEALEIRLIELREIEFCLAVLRRSGPGSRPRLRRHAEMKVGELGLEVLPTPEPNEVMAVIL